MDRLIITADDGLYERLAEQVRADDDVPCRASNALSGLEWAVSRRPGMILLDMALRSADTLLEALHHQPETAAIPLLAVVDGAGLPFELRRLCAAVLNLKTANDADDRP
jgi:DNA-binding response OmpR family regulator